MSHEPSCLKFYAHMYGKSMGSINIREINTITGTSVQIFSRQGQQGGKWFDNAIHLPTGRPFKVSSVPVLLFVYGNLGLLHSLHFAGKTSSSSFFDTVSNMKPFLKDQPYFYTPRI